MPACSGGKGGSLVNEGRYLDKDRVVVLYSIKKLIVE